MWLALLAACAPGVFWTEQGRDPIRSAWYAADDSTPTLVLLSNSTLLCELPESDDPAEIQAALARQAAGLTREGASVLFFQIDAAQGDLVGDYELGSPVDARQMVATWWHVNEAVVEARSGIVVTYAAGAATGDLEYVPAVSLPGTLTIEEDDGQLHGSFELDTIDVSGRFVATGCSPDASLFNSLAI